jgi:hypothetical protein
MADTDDAAARNRITGQEHGVGATVRQGLRRFAMQRAVPWCFPSVPDAEPSATARVTDLDAYVWQPCD